MQIRADHQDFFTPRLHYLPEWIEHMRTSQADVAEALGVDKGTVSRWCAGALPERPNLEALAACLGREEMSELFHHPEDNWLHRRLRRASKEQQDKARRAVKAVVREILPATGTDD